MEQAGITDLFTEIDCAEIYVAFSWFEPMWLENMSGGVLSTNPIGA